jgi:hypothetical protein
MKYRVFPLVSGEYGYESDSVSIGAWVVVLTDAENHVHFPTQPPSFSTPGKILPAPAKVYERLSEANDAADELNAELRWSGG